MAKGDRGWITVLGQLVWRNGITLFGCSLTTVSACAIVVFLVLGLVGVPLSPYIGILTYLLLPGVFLFGLLLIPLGGYIDRRRRRAANLDEPAHIDLDFNSPRIRKLAVIVTVLTVVNFIIISSVSYEGAVYMESVEFCGLTCHTVMAPEFTAHANSPHAHVKCVDCHIGPGLPSLVHAKLNGLNQVYGVLTGSYEKPVPTPVHALSNAELTCGECHDPEQDLGDKLVVSTDYTPDDANTPLSSVLLMHIGGRGAERKGIHSWHLSPGREVSFYASDDKRETIPYVKVTEADGDVTEYWTGDADSELANFPADQMRTMDCTDCHNRATHQFAMPGPALNAAIAGGRIDVALPAIKMAGLAALEGAPAAEDGAAFIASHLKEFYAANHAEVAVAQSAALDTAIAEIQAIYTRNNFPAMDVTWGTYPDHIGHTQFTGCFRCHDDGHSSKDGARVITQDCTICHNVVSWQEENPEILSALGLQ
jgi:membrane-associated protease RseP (regulator of RpoE activity)